MAIETPVDPLPAVESLTEIELKGEQDRAFTTPNGTKIRARLMKIAETAAKAPAKGDVKLAPSTINLSLSLAKLNDDLSVATDEQGRLLIMDAHEIVVSAAMMNDKANFEANMDLILRQQAHEFERRLGARADVDAYLTGHWGA